VGQKHWIDSDGTSWSYRRQAAAAYACIANAGECGEAACDRKTYRLPEMARRVHPKKDKSLSYGYGMPL